MATTGPTGMTGASSGLFGPTGPTGPTGFGGFDIGGTGPVGDVGPLKIVGVTIGGTSYTITLDESGTQYNVNSYGFDDITLTLSVAGSPPNGSFWSIRNSGNGANIVTTYATILPGCVTTFVYNSGGFYIF